MDKDITDLIGVNNNFDKKFFSLEENISQLKNSKLDSLVLSNFKIQNLDNTIFKKHAQLYFKYENNIYLNAIVFNTNKVIVTIYIFGIGFVNCTYGQICFYNNKFKNKLFKLFHNKNYKNLGE